MPKKFFFRYPFLLLVTISAVPACSQQQNRKLLLGINLHTLPANSYEMSSAYSFNSRLEATLKVGYTGKKGIRFQNDVDDLFENKTHAGYFVKSGARFILKDRYFLSAEAIVSYYKNTGWHNVDDALVYQSAKGTIVGLGLSPGFRFPIKKRLLIDLGLQVAFAQTRNDYVGTRYHNYQPGLGSLGGDPYLQGICSIMVKL
jgi:hypothetical protein